jgi:sugar/nucleoside kinase (ribokinase family)
MTISFDTNYDPSERWNDGLYDLLGMVDVFLPNEAELSAIYGAIKGAMYGAISGLANLPDALDWLAARVPLAAVKLGPRGAAALRGGERWQVDALPVSVVDTVGAGDSFDAGFIRGYLDGWHPLDCLKLANACGALSTRSAGGTAAQPTMEEIRKLGIGD